MMSNLFYIIPAFILVVCGNNLHKRNSYNFFISVFILIVFSGLKDPFLYPDNYNYYRFFLGETSVEEIEGSLNFGFIFFNKVVHFVYPNFFFYCFIVSAIIVLSYSNMIRRYSPNIGLSLILFVLINYYPSFFLLRQYLTMPFFFLAVKYTMERNQKMFIFSVFLAFSLHFTAIIMLPLYYVYGVKYSKKNFFIICCGTVLAIVGFMTLGDIVQRINPYYAQYFNMKVAESAWQRALMKCFILWLYMYTLGAHFYENGINRVVFYCMLFSVIISVGAMNMFGVFRLRDYFSLADIIGLPIIFCYARQLNWFKRTLSRVSALVYIVLLIISMNNFIQGENIENTYDFFWNGIVRSR